MNQQAAMDKEMLVRFIMDAARRAMIHYGFWMREVEYQLGQAAALEIEKAAGDLSLNNQLNRLSKVLGFEVKNGAPAVLYEMSEEKLNRLLEAICSNWLANDGFWFQAVEKAYDMFDAKRCNDTCWTRFSPLEASRIKVLLNLPENGGLKALKTALGFRLYARLNEQAIIDETPDSFTFLMVDCRVQSARRRKGLEEYPCQSAGMVEYRTFAQTIDSRIETECLGCPPGRHPEDWFCGWRFSLK
ncbi:MAG: DUF6125 family protein [Thermodesulfobacteriota bacterium]